VAFTAQDITVTNRAVNLWYAGQHVPLVRLEPSLHPVPFSSSNGANRQVALIIKSAEAKVAVAVDEIEAESEIVVRSLGTFLRRIENISGITFTAAGEMFFVLNPADLVRAVLDPRLVASAASTADTVLFGAPDRSQMVILVVDDSVTSRMLNQKLLASSGFQVITASDGQRALDTLRANRCHLVVADVQMPNVDGYELTRRIKQDPGLRHIPVILLTSLAGPEDKARGIEVGADAYLVKREVSQESLVGTIDQLI
jgi:two-component system chemotaxis sensor kinase CheA